jgi:ABC-type dipeptide/oligopeptide/nickel transport system permease subunit
MWRRPPAVVGAAVVLLFVGLALGAPWIARSDPQSSDYSRIRKPPSAANLFGTDDLGRDIFSRVVWGTRISMQAGVFSIVLAIAIGVPAGLLSGSRSGITDQLIMRLTDAWLAFPFLILAIGLVTIMGASLTNATVAIGLAATPTYIRLTRGLVLSTREEDYVQAARALGAGGLRTILRHVLPNIVSALLLQATVSIPAAIIAEAITVVPRPRRAAADAQLGHDAEHRAAVPGDRAVDGLVARARHLRADPVVQPGR